MLLGAGGVGGSVFLVSFGVLIPKLDELNRYLSFLVRKGTKPLNQACWSLVGLDSVMFSSVAS